MLKNNKIYNYWQDDVHTKAGDLETLSNVVAFVDSENKLVMDKIEENLKKLDKEFIKEIKKDEKKITVVTEYLGIETTVDLIVNRNKNLVAKEVVSALHVPGVNNGVKGDLIKKRMKNPMSLIAIAKFDTINPLASYYSQYKVLFNAVESEFLFDINSKKLFPTEYKKYIDVVGSEFLINSVYTVLLTKQGWVGTSGLSRFHLKDIEMNSVKDLGQISLLFKTINNNRLLKGELDKDILINYGGFKFFTLLDIEDVIDNFPKDYYKYANYKKGDETNKFRTVLIPFKDKDVDVKNISYYVSVEGFETQGINFETHEFLINKVGLCRKTLPYLFDFCTPKNDFLLMVEFELDTDGKREYLYATITSIRGEEFTGALNRDSLNNENLKKGSELNINIKKIINWEIRLSNRVTINPNTAYVLDIIKKMNEK